MSRRHKVILLCVRQDQLRRICDHARLVTMKGSQQQASCAQHRAGRLVTMLASRWECVVQMGADKTYLAVLVHVIEHRAVLASQEHLHLILKLILKQKNS